MNIRTGSSFAAIILKFMYGIDVDLSDKKYIPLLHSALQGPTEAMLAGSFLVEYVPILQYLPAWFPGGAFQRKFARWKRLAGEFLETPFAEAKQAWVRLEAGRKWSECL